MKIIEYNHNNNNNNFVSSNIFKSSTFWYIPFVRKNKIAYKTY